MVQLFYSMTQNTFIHLINIFKICLYSLYARNQFNGKYCFLIFFMSFRQFENNQFIYKRLISFAIVYLLKILHLSAINNHSTHGYFFGAIFFNK